jgi:Flp pilus assembly protein TadD
MVLAIGLALPAATWAAGSSSNDDNSASNSSMSGDDLSQAQDKIDAEDYQDAIPLLEKIVRESPDNADAYNLLGYSHRKLGDHAKALTNYQKALALEPEHLGANEYLGELYLEMKDLPKAEERLAVLANACTDCEEYEDLKEQIDEYKAKQQAS